MTSEIRVNKLQNRVGLGTVEYTNTGIVVSGIVTCTELSGLTALNIAGVGTANTLDINGDIDVDGHTNLDNVSVAGVTTTTDHIYIDADNKKLNIGDGSDLQLYHTGARSEIINNTGDLIIQPGASSNLLLRSQTGAPHFKGAHAAQVELYWNGNKKFETTNTGAVVTGILTATTSFVTTGNVVANGTMTVGSYGLFGSLVANDPGSNYYGTTNRFGGGVSISGALNIDGDIGHIGDTNTKIRFPTDDTFSVETGGDERFRITSDGKVCIAHNGALHSGILQVSATGADAIDINSYSTNANSGGRLSFYRSKNASIGSNTIVDNDDSLGRIDFRGYNTNGNSYDQGATIEARVDGSVNSSTDMPTAILFKTSGEGSASPDERLRIYGNGAVLIGADSGEAGGDAKLAIDCQGLNIFDGVGDPANYGLIFANDPTTNKANGIGFFNDSASTCGGYIVHQDKGGGNIGDLVFGTSATSDTPVERLRITSGGNVQLNTDGQQLTFGSSQKMKFYYESSEDRMYLQGDGAYGFAFRVNNGNALEIDKTTRDVTMQGASGRNFLWDNSEPSLYLTDNGSNSARLKIGTGGDLQLYHDVSGNLNHIIAATNGEIKFSANQFSFYDYSGVTERARLKSTGEFHISDRNSSNTGDHFFQAGAFGIRMEDTGGYNRWNIERNYGGFQSTPLVHLSAQGRVGINTPNPSKLLTVHGGDLAVSEGRLHLSSDSDAAVPGSSFGYQVISGKKQFSGSNTYVGLAYVGHSHSIQIQYMCIENGNTALGGSHGEIFFHTTYGSSQQGISQQAYTNAMNGGRITSGVSFQYQNTGAGSHGGNYVLRAKVSYSGSNHNFALHYTIKGISAGNMYT